MRNLNRCYSSSSWKQSISAQDLPLCKDFFRHLDRLPRLFFITYATTVAYYLCVACSRSLHASSLGRGSSAFCALYAVKLSFAVLRNIYSNRLMQNVREPKTLVSITGCAVAPAFCIVLTAHTRESGKWRILTSPRVWPWEVFQFRKYSWNQGRPNLGGMTQVASWIF